MGVSSGWTKFRVPLLIVFLVLFFDQWLKIYIKTHYTIGQQFHILGDFFRLYFIENNGMAFGMELGGIYGKIILTTFRLVAVSAIGYYLYNLTRKQGSIHLIVALSLILAGALGNIIDSVFYGVIFNESTYYQPATIFPEAGGYSTWLQGKVVDMFYFEFFNIPREDAPNWLPGFLFGPDDRFIFFRPIFNLADAAISVGMGIILVFQKRIFDKH